MVPRGAPKIQKPIWKTPGEIAKTRKKFGQKVLEGLTLGL
jgi:hypothetical protein